MTDVILVNRTSQIRDMRFQALLPALQAQVTDDFAPFWGTPANLHFIGRREPNPTSGWPLWLLDTADVAGDLGYHEADDGTPEGRVFVADDLRYGAEISVTISHELLELLADPMTTRLSPEIDGAEFSIEVCDPVEADTDGYIKDGFRLSNFVTPSYYRLDQGARYDFCALLSAPCPATRPGGYLLSRRNGVWSTTARRYQDGSLSYRAMRQLGRQERRVRAG